jgi:hypothetical protein
LTVPHAADRRCRRRRGARLQFPRLSLLRPTGLLPEPLPDGDRPQDRLSRCGPHHPDARAEPLGSAALGTRTTIPAH